MVCKTYSVRQLTYTCSAPAVSATQLQGVRIVILPESANPWEDRPGNLPGSAKPWEDPPGNLPGSANPWEDRPAAPLRSSFSTYRRVPGGVPSRPPDEFLQDFLTSSSPSWSSLLEFVADFHRGLE